MTKPVSPAFDAEIALALMGKAIQDGTSEGIEGCLATQRAYAESEECPPSLRKEFEEVAVLWKQYQEGTETQQHLTEKIEATCRDLGEENSIQRFRAMVEGKDQEAITNYINGVVPRLSPQAIERILAWLPLDTSLRQQIENQRAP